MSEPIVIIGAGPAGLTAGLELLRAGRRNVTILEATQDIGGLSKTVNYKGNRIDIGGHRFFSKSDWVMDWWRDLLPVALPEAAGQEPQFRLAYQGAQRLLGANVVSARESDEAVMLVRNRLSRIYWGGKFFDYPLKPGLDMAAKLGPLKCLRLGASYMQASLRPITPERTLEDFFINRFGRQLYRTFFKEYTEKVWGVPCQEISADWGAQRVKSLSIGKALVHALKKAVTGSRAFCPPSMALARCGRPLRRASRPAAAGWCAAQPWTGLIAATTASRVCARAARTAVSWCCRPVTSFPRCRCAS